jgi:hypothetical protein
METTHWFYAPASQAGRDLEMGAAALMELVGMEAGQSESTPPRCKLDLLRMGGGLPSQRYGNGDCLRWRFQISAPVRDQSGGDGEIHELCEGSESERSACF